MIRRQHNAVVTCRFEQLARHSDLVHAVSTRSGGVPCPGSNRLNLAYHVGDDPAVVDANRHLFLEAIGLLDWPPVSVRQVHGDRLLTVRAADAPRLHARCWADLPEADAIVCPDPDVLLMAYSADCPLVLLWDEHAKVVGLVHSSWRCTVARLVEKTIAHMVATLGCRPESIHAGIGPSIGPCCFEVRQDVLDQARAVLPDADALFRFGHNRMTFDLWQAIRVQLVAAGVDDANIECARLCTACHTDEFFSYRTEGPDTGRFAAVIGRRQP